MATQKNHLDNRDTKSKRQLILDYSHARGLERVGVREIRAIEAELRRRLGDGEKTSPSYIANVLREGGAHVEYDDRYVDPWMEEPYATRLQGLLQFRDLQDAEFALQKLDAVYREFRQDADRVGTSLVRALVLKGKQRAEGLAANRRVSPGKRQEKREIATWFRVWLQISDLFFDWLELRKQSDEYQRMFAPHDGQKDSVAREI